MKSFVSVLFKGMVEAMNYSVAGCTLQQCEQLVIVLALSLLAANLANTK